VTVLVIDPETAADASAPCPKVKVVVPPAAGIDTALPFTCTDPWFPAVALAAAAAVAVFTAMGALRLHAAEAEIGDVTLNASTVPTPATRLVRSR
jgi:hypothetical protein